LACGGTGRLAATSRPDGPIDFHRLAERLKLAAEPTRPSLLLLLAEGEWSFGTIAQEFPITQVAVSQHMAQLQLAGLVESRRVGKQRVYTLTAEGRDLLRIVEAMTGGK
jgi:DNA-binding transcriptional ArsR family regulator